MASESHASSRLTGGGAELDIAHLLRKLGFVLETNVWLHESGRPALDAEESEWRLRLTAQKVQRGQANFEEFSAAWYNQRRYFPKRHDLKKVAKSHLPVQEVDFILKGFQRYNPDHPVHVYAQAQSGFITTEGRPVCVSELLDMLYGAFLVEVTQKSRHSGPRNFKTTKLRALSKLAEKRRQNEKVLLLFNGGEPGEPPIEPAFCMSGLKILYFNERTIGRVPENLEKARREAAEEAVAREVILRKAAVAREVALREAAEPKAEALQRQLDEQKATRSWPLPFAIIRAVFVVVAGMILASLFALARN